MFYKIDKKKNKPKKIRTKNYRDYKKSEKSKICNEVFKFISDDLGFDKKEDVQEILSHMVNHTHFGKGIQIESSINENLLNEMQKQANKRRENKNLLINIVRKAGLTRAQAREVLGTTIW